MSLVRFRLWAPSFSQRNQQLRSALSAAADVSCRIHVAPGFPAFPGLSRQVRQIRATWMQHGGRLEADVLMDIVRADDGVYEMPQPLALYAFDLLERADQYRRATKVLSELQPEPPYKLVYPMYFSLAHALELYFKAFLVLHGMTKKETRRSDIRHSPLKLCMLCHEAGLAHIDMLEHMALQIEEMNSNFDFRYPTGFRLHLPTMSMCLPVLDALHDTLAPVLADGKAKAQLRWASDTRHLKGQKIRWSD